MTAWTTSVPLHEPTQGRQTMQIRYRHSRVALAASLVTVAVASPVLAGNPDRDAYFGETHVHTSWSLDAWLLGNRVTGPADAYKYFKGQPIKHPAGYDVKIVTPLDWAGVTDHSEYVGVIKYANDPNSPVRTPRSSAARSCCCRWPAANRRP